MRINLTNLLEELLMGHLQYGGLEVWDGDVQSQVTFLYLSAEL